MRKRWLISIAALLVYVPLLFGVAMYMAYYVLKHGGSDIMGLAAFMGILYFGGSGAAKATARYIVHGSIIPPTEKKEG